MLTGQNGILKRASEVKEKTDQSSDLEFLQIKANEALTKYYLSTNTEPENEYILKRLNEESDISADEITGTVMYNGRTYDVSDILGNTNEQTNIASQNIKLKQITKCTATEERDILLLENGKIRMIIQEENNNALRAVIPKGFYYVTGAPSTGVVISDKFGDDDNNSKGGNQFVWVPCEGKTAGNYEKTRDKDNKYGIAANWSQYNNYSNSYNNYNDWTDYGGDLESVEKYGGFYVARYEAGIPTNAPFYANTDGALYDIEERNTTNYKPVSKKNVQAWNCVYQVTAKILGKQMYEANDSVTSQLIDSYAWDTIVNWVEKDTLKLGDDSTEYGNYYNSGLKIFNSLYAMHQVVDGKWILTRNYKKGSTTITGYTELATGASISNESNGQNKIKNIYDMAGNMWEWTTEVGNHNSSLVLLTEEQTQTAEFAVIRGGSFSWNGNKTPISCRNGVYGASTSNYVDFGFRVGLYIQ